MACGKTYNAVDCKQQLLLIGVKEGEYGGYRHDLLVNSLNEVETDFYICTKCNGVMRNACQIGDEQSPVCEICVEEGEKYQPMVKSRENIPGLRTKCPLTSRGCEWEGIMGEIDSHLDECPELIVNCSNMCGIILKQFEQINHCEKECPNRTVSCGYCEATMRHKELENHDKVCPESPIICPNECLKSLARKEMELHVGKECPNTFVACPYKEMGCNVLTKRYEVQKHEKLSESKHLEMTVSYYSVKVKRMEVEMENKEKNNGRLVVEVENLMRQIEEKEVLRLFAEDRPNKGQKPTKSSYPITSSSSFESETGSILRPRLKINKLHHKSRHSFREPEFYLLPEKREEHLKIGFLVRYGSGVSGWTRNLVALVDGALHFYNTAEDYGAKPTDTLQISECDGVRAYADGKIPKKLKFLLSSSSENGFVIRMNANYFAADTFQEAKEWLELLVETWLMHYKEKLTKIQRLRSASTGDEDNK